MTAAVSDLSQLRAAPEAAELRAQLGIPSDARQVLVFGETSHWDPNWLRTADEYFEGQVVPVIQSVLRELRADPRRVFSIESTFFLERFWERHPEHQRELHALLEQRRLRLSGTGITTPDTVIPNAEAILRDYLLGDQWLRSIGIRETSALAYLPDDFGYAPTLPSLLTELGFTQAAITRIDGAYFIGSDYRSAAAYPLKGSSAELLQDEHRTADFVWVAPDGREVLCHWNPFTYFQGDMLAYVGIIRWMGKTFGMSWRTRKHIARRVASYVDALSALARTPYLFCPIGCDFNPPIPDLGMLLDRYNDEIYPETGTWLLSAGLDDYLNLVDTRRDALPRLELDLNPYWMGFYASRPEAKVRHQRVTRKLLLAEATDATRRFHGATGEPDGPALFRRLWTDLAFANHHDFVTGTSPDRVWTVEQAPLLRAAEAEIDGWLERSGHRVAEVAARKAPRGVHLRRRGHRLTVETPGARLVFDEEQGGALVEWHTADGVDVITGPSLDLGLYRDSGGLWRLGHEFAGGRFCAIASAKQQAGSVRATHHGDRALIVHRACLGGLSVERRIWVFAHQPEIVVEVQGGLPLGTSLCLETATGVRTASWEMDVPGGLVTRPRQKLYDPTFWPAFSFAHVAERARGLVIYTAGPSSVSLEASGRLRAMVQRNAPRETAFGVVPVLAHPARGTDPGFAVVCAFGPTRGHKTPASALRQRAHALLQDVAVHGPNLAAHSPLPCPVTVSGDAFVSAFKVADEGPGFIVRLTGATGQTVTLRGTQATLRRAARVDARENDRRPLPVTSDGAVAVELDGETVSVRIEP